MLFRRAKKKKRSQQSRTRFGGEQLENRNLMTAVGFDVDTVSPTAETPDATAASVTGIFLRTDVDSLTAQTTGMGLGSDLNLGNYTGSAEIQAVQIPSTTDAPGHNIGLMSTGGDLEIGW